MFGYSLSACAPFPHHAVLRPGRIARARIPCVKITTIVGIAPALELGFLRAAVGKVEISLYAPIWAYNTYQIGRETMAWHVAYQPDGPCRNL